jgi:hypothetical protein
MEEGILTFITIITIIFGIFHIILFFKIWGMTNDVKEIKEKFTAGEGKLMDAQIHYMKGDMAKCKDILDEALFRDIFNIYNDIFNIYNVWNDICTYKYNDKFKITSNRYQKLYSKMGIEMPDIKKYKDYRNLPVATNSSNSTEPDNVTKSTAKSGNHPVAPQNLSIKTDTLENEDARWLKRDYPDLFSRLLKEAGTYHKDERDVMNEVNKQSECFAKIPNGISNEYIPLHTNANNTTHFYNLYITRYHQDCTFDEFIFMNKGRYSEIRARRLKVNCFIYDFDENLKLTGVYKSK